MNPGHRVGGTRGMKRIHMRGHFLHLSYESINVQKQKLCLIRVTCPVGLLLFMHVAQRTGRLRVKALMYCG
jgi:hypothetical protein